MTHTISVTDRTDDVYGQVWIDSETNKPGPTPSLRAQLGFGPDAPTRRITILGVGRAIFNTDAGNNDEFKASLLRCHWHLRLRLRYTTSNASNDLCRPGRHRNGYSPSQAGSLIVISSGDTTAPPFNG